MKKFSTALTALLTVAVAFTITGILLFGVVERRVKPMAQRSGSELASSNADMVIAALERKYQRLQLTQNEEAYQQAFKDMAIKEISEMPSLEKNGIELVITDSTGKQLLSKKPQQQAVVQGKKTKAVYQTSTKEFSPWKWTVSCALQSTNKDNELRSLKYEFMAAAVLCYIIAAFLIIIILRRMTMPLRAMAEAAEKVAEGDLEANPPVSTGEAAMIAQSIIKIKQTLRSYKENTEDMAHFTEAGTGVLHEYTAEISNYTAMLKKRAEKKLDAESKNMADEILSSSGHMESLMKDMTAYIGICERQFEKNETDTAAIMAEIKNDISIAGSAAIEYDGSEMPVIKADKEAIKLLLRALVHNGVKFNRSNAPKVIIKSELRGAQWTFMIMDNGIGIETENREKIFQPFQRLNPLSEFQGNALNLALCKKTVARHGGRIWVEERKDKNPGSVFYFTLPA